MVARGEGSSETSAEVSKALVLDRQEAHAFSFGTVELRPREVEFSGKFIVMLPYGDPKHTPNAGPTQRLFLGVVKKELASSWPPGDPGGKNMAAPFAARWEVTSHLQNHGSFVEAARVRPLATLDVSGELWVERLLPTLTGDKKARVLRRWYLASRLTSTRWPQLVDMGEESGRHWAVVEAPGQRPEDTFPNPHVEQGLREVRALALAMAEAEAVLGESLIRAALAVRPSVLARSPAGRLMLQLAALDPEPDEGFATPSEWRLFTPEELLGHPATPRSNVFSLGWLLCLVLTGRGPYEAGPAGDGVSAQASREALLPLILGGRIRSLGFPDVVKGAENRRAPSPGAGAGGPVCELRRLRRGDGGAGAALGRAAALEPDRQGAGSPVVGRRRAAALRAGGEAPAAHGRARGVAQPRGSPR